ncbi:MAG: CBS domain-containing protein, partial [Rhabdochlamydiaceae bacterium]
PPSLLKKSRWRNRAKNLPERTGDLWWLFSRQTISVTQKEDVLNAAIVMQKRNFRHLPVITESGKIAGIVSAQDIIDSLALVLGPGSTHEKIVESLNIPVHRIMAIHPIVVEKGDGLSEVVKKLIAHNVGALPVVDEMGRVQGIITLRDIVGLLGTGSEPLGVKVSELMTRKITTIEPESTVSEAVRLMSEIRVRRLPVLSRKRPDLLGMFTNKDVLRLVSKLASGEKDSNVSFGSTISENMTKEVINISQDDDIRVAASRMMIFGIGGLGVETPESKISGLITERDLVKRLSEVRSVSFLVDSMKFELELQN